jgi:hypothetical protein
MLKATSFLSIIAYLLIATTSFGASGALTGTVTDTMCGKKHMIAGKTDAECTRECMKSKGDWTYGLIVGDNVYKLTGDTKKLGTFAGQHVKVTGEMTGTTIAVQTIALTKR